MRINKNHSAMPLKRKCRVRNAFKKIGRGLRTAGLAVLFAGMVALPLKAKAEPKVEEPSKEPEKKELVLPRAYPDFSGQGILGNPAFWSQLGNWANISHKVNKDLVHDSDITVSMDLIKGIFLNVDAGTTIDGKEKQTGRLSIDLALPVGLGTYFGTSVSSALTTEEGEMIGKFGTKIGFVNVAKFQKFLLRTGLGYFSLLNHSIKGAIEARMLLDPIELTFSVNSSGSLLNGDYLGTGFGTQIGWKMLLASFGIVPENKFDGIAGMQAHFRYIISGDKIVDVFANFTPNEFASGKAMFTYLF